MLTMIVAATTAHWSNGWHALPEAKLTVPWEWRADLIEEGLDRKDQRGQSRTRGEIRGVYARDWG